MITPRSSKGSLSGEVTHPCSHPHALQVSTLLQSTIWPTLPLPVTSRLVERGSLFHSPILSVYLKVQCVQLATVAGFTQHTAFEFLGPYLREDPLKLYYREFKDIMKLIEVVPAQPAVEGMAEQLEQHARNGIPAVYNAAGVQIQPGGRRCRTFHMWRQSPLELHNLHVKSCLRIRFFTSGSST